MSAEDFAVELVPLASLKPHPRNVWKHPQDEIDHLKASIEQHTLYRNIVVARDLTILAGHGITEAARQLGRKRMPVRRLDLDPNSAQALKVLVTDNVIAHLAEVDDRELADILREVREQDVAGLLGTGYDEMMLANLIYVTRPEAEVRDQAQAAHWAGMPEYDEGEEHVLRLTVRFENEADRARFAEVTGLRLTDRTFSAWWPPRTHDDTGAVKFVEVEAEVG